MLQLLERQTCFTHLAVGCFTKQVFWTPQDTHPHWHWEDMEVVVFCNWKKKKGWGFERDPYLTGKFSFFCFLRGKKSLRKFQRSRYPQNPGGVSPRSPPTKHPSTSQDPGKPGGFVPNGSVNMVIVTLSSAFSSYTCCCCVIRPVGITTGWCVYSSSMVEKNNHSGLLW